MKKNIYHNGFTLIETLLYIAIFALIMSGTLISVYAIFGGEARNQTKVIVQEEGSYLLGKIDWVLSGIKDATVSADGLKLTVNKFDTSFGNPIVLRIVNGDLMIKKGVHDEEILNNSNVSVSCEAIGCFDHNSASGDGINPESVEGTITVNSKTSEGLSYSQEFSTIKYLRK